MNKTKTIKKILFTVALVVAGLTSVNSLSVSPVHASNQPVPPPAEDLDSGAFMFDLSSITHKSLEGSTRQSWIRRGINYFFERIVGFLAAVIGTLAVLMLTIGGFLMLSSAGNEQRYEQGKNYAKYALIGLGVTLSAYILVTLVQLLIRSIYG